MVEVKKWAKICKSLFVYIACGGSVYFSNLKLSSLISMLLFRYAEPFI